MTYIGLDFETTGLDPLKHVPLTLGLAWEILGEIQSKEFEFEFDVRFEGTNPTWDIEAMYVNRLDPVMEYRSRTRSEQDWEICKFLMETLGCSPFDKSLVPVGWNVGGFDMRFMQTFFPQASKFFSHRYLELNSLAYALQATGHSDVKEACKQYAEDESAKQAYDPNWHNAEWDARASLLAKEFIDTQLIYIADNID